MSKASILPLRLAEVSFAAGGRTIIDRVSLEIETGPSTIILGANGAGKSVLMRLMHGLLEPSSGRIDWNAPERPGAPRKQAMVFQRPVMLRRSAYANVAYALTIAGIPEPQRLALARAWALHPEVLFLDEPTASLDPSATREIESVIKAFDAAGTKVVMATHNLGQARRLGDEILFLDQGRLVERSPVEDFFSKPQSVQAAAFIKGELPWA